MVCQAPAFSFSKLQGLDAYLSPEMKSTGEAIGYDDRLTRALYKALQASGMHVTNYGTVFVTVADRDKEEALPLVRRFYRMGFNIQATEGTARFLKANGIRTHSVGKIHGGSQEILSPFARGLSIMSSTPRTPETPKAWPTAGRCVRWRFRIMSRCLRLWTRCGFFLDVLEETAIGVSTIDASPGGSV